MILFWKIFRPLSRAWSALTRLSSSSDSPRLCDHPTGPAADIRNEKVSHHKSVVCIPLRESRPPLPAAQTVSKRLFFIPRFPRILNERELTDALFIPLNILFGTFPLSCQNRTFFGCILVGVEQSVSGKNRLPAPDSLRIHPWIGSLMDSIHGKSPHRPSSVPLVPFWLFPSIRQ